MLEQSYIKGLEFTQAYTVDDCNYHSNLASSLSEKPVINYKDIYNLQNIKRANEFVQKGISKIEEKDFESALKCLDTAISIQPKLIPALIQRGCVHFNRGFPIQAIQDFKLVLEIDPSNVEGQKYFDIALNLLESNQKPTESSKKRSKNASESGSSSSDSDSDVGRKEKKKHKKHHKHKHKKTKKHKH